MAHHHHPLIYASHICQQLPLTVTEPPPHQPDKAPTEKDEKNDQQQQNTPLK